MPSDETSPLHRLISPWWHKQEKPLAWQVPALRVTLAETAIAELQIHISDQSPYCPFTDARVQWAAAFLTHLENSWFGIHEDITARAAWAFDPPTRCGKDMAVGST